MSVKKGKGWILSSNDKGYDRIMRDLARIDGAMITTGVHEGAGSYVKSKKPIAYVAAVNEYGHEESNIPARPFLSTAFDENRENWREFGRDIIKDVILGKQTLKRGMKRLGTIQMMAVRSKITKIKQPANAPSTVARKGFNNPLIHTRTLRNSINFEVTGAGSGSR